MNTHLAPEELAKVMQQLTNPQAASVAEHVRPSGPLVVELRWRLADIGVGEWFMQLLKLWVAMALVGVVVAIPGWLIYLFVVGAAVAKASQ